MAREIEMEESSNDRIAQRFKFPFCDEDDLPKSEIHRVESDSDYSSYVTSSFTLSPAPRPLRDSSGNSFEGIELSIPLSSPSKLQQDIMPIKSQSLQSWPRQLQIKRGTRHCTLQVWK